MPKILYICLLLCSCGNINQTFNCVSMRFSNALPVQMWLDGKETFNEKKENYIDQFCFNQRFKCGTDIRFRFADSKVKTLYLKGYDLDNTEVLNLPCTRTQVNKLIFQDEFHSIHGWAGQSYGVSTKVNPWAWSGGLVRSNVRQVGAPPEDTLVLYKVLLSPGNPLPAGQYYLNVYYELGDSSTDEQTVTLQMYLINSGAIVKTINVDTFKGQTSNYTKQITEFPFLADVSYDTIGFGFVYNANALHITVAIGEVDVNSMTGNYYDVNFVGSDYSLCNSKLQLFLKGKYGIGILNQFEQFGQLVADPLINLQSTYPDVTLGSLTSGHNTIYIKSTVVDLVPGDYTFNFLFNSTQQHGIFRLEFFAGGVLVGFNDGSFDGVSGDLTVSIPITIANAPDEVRITITNTTFAASNTFKFYSIGIDDSFYNIGKSDFIEITSVTGQLQTIKYKSIENFAGLIWNESDSYMQLDVDARFYHTRPKDTVKAIDLSNSRVIGTASELKEQINLQVYAQPPYMNRKVELALMHSVNGNVSINEQDITMEEAYATTDLGEFNPFSTAECWLTNKTFIERNVI